ncbi:MAG: DUF5716 family protein [Lachnospiraceae bacterium]
MVAGIELRENYAQVCVRTPFMKEPETVSIIAGEEQYLIPMEEIWKDREVCRKYIRKLLKYIRNYGNTDTIKALTVCLEENTEEKRILIREILEVYGISAEKIYFLDPKEAFCAYVLNQAAELSQYYVLLIEHRAGKKNCQLLYKENRKLPCIVEVREITDQSLAEIMKGRKISSVFLVGEEFEESWIEENRDLLRLGRRVFYGKNLYSKGSCYRAMEIRSGKAEYYYLGETKTRYHIAIRSEKAGKEGFEIVLEAGKNWYEAGRYLEVLLLERPQMEFAVIPMFSKERKILAMNFEDLPKRPPRTTRLAVHLQYVSAAQLHIKVCDLGFGELFPKSEKVYEKNLDLQKLWGE